MIGKIKQALFGVRYGNPVQNITETAVKDKALLEQIKTVGIQSYAANALGISTRDIPTFQEWSKKSRDQKLDNLIGNEPSSIKEFHAMMLSHYRKDKKKHRAAWKKKTWVGHATIIKKIVDKAIEKEEILVPDILEMGMRLFYMFRTFVLQSFKDKPKAVIAA